MSRYTAFCNNNTDLQGVLANLNDYDRKRVLPPNWASLGNNLYRLNNTGYVSLLYKDGKELGASITETGITYTDTAVNTAEAVSQSETAIDVSTSGGSFVAAGFIVKMDDEKMLITDYTGTVITVERGLFGTTQTEHTTAEDIYFLNKNDPSTSDYSQLNEANEWCFDTSSDAIYLYSTSTPNTSVFEAGQDWDSLKTTVCKEQADRVRSFINRPIYKRSNSSYKGATDRDYDWILIRINAILAAADLVRSGGDIEKADEIEAMATNEDGSGLLDKLQRREYCLWNETAWRTESGIIQEVSINASTTGYIEDIKLNGPPGCDYDEVKCVISTAGTFATGSASGVKYDVYVKDSSGLKMSKVVDGETINGDYQTLAYGAEIRFQAGVYTVNDEWAIIFQSDEIPIGSIKSGQIYR